MSFFYHSAPFPVFCTLKMKCFLLYNRNWGPKASVSCPLYHGYYQRKNNVWCLFSVYWYLASCILYICKSMVINFFSLSLSLSLSVSVNSPHKGQWRGALMFSLICVWINGWVSNREAGDLRHHRGHYDVSVIIFGSLDWTSYQFTFWSRYLRLGDWLSLWFVAQRIDGFPVYVGLGRSY